MSAHDDGHGAAQLERACLENRHGAAAQRMRSVLGQTVGVAARAPVDHLEVGRCARVHPPRWRCRYPSHALARRDHGRGYWGAKRVFGDFPFGNFFEIYCARHRWAHGGDDDGERVVVVLLLFFIVVVFYVFFFDFFSLPRPGTGGTSTLAAVSCRAQADSGSALFSRQGDTEQER